jgi:regulator of protease activity HflC (stomatin/prohibitin superfamily)
MKSIKSLFILCCAALMAACSQIDTGNVGVTKSLGQVNPTELSAGTHWTFFQSVDEVSVKEIPLSLTDLKPQTSDKITLADLDIDIYVQTAPDKAADIMTRFTGDLVYVKGEDGARVGMNYVTRQAREAVYAVATKYGSDVIHLKRSEIAGDVQKSLQADLDASAGKGWFFVRSVNVRNLVTDPALEANIKAAANARFEEQAKQQQITVAKAEAERQRIIAEGEAAVVKIRSQAAAAQGGKEYLELLKIQNETAAIAKWDGKLPVTSAGGAVPFINVGK